MIMTVWLAARIFSSSVEYRPARLYNSSIVVGGSRDSEWKKGVDGSKVSLIFEGLRPCCKILFFRRPTRTSS